ncbi:SCO family protein [Parvularcula marina]|uniref:SCO family protein n=1 Tax=Parvularcula marina TaxID=2292771 RepID=A0A371RIZ9_9PROT|nr:SCO family protein [Parvularcula marina]RFB05404.1 SCO family protein [Parvularcula marina]
MTLRHSILLLMAAPFMLSACGGESSQTDIPRAGEIRLNSRFDADFDLIAQTGETVTDEDFEGKPMFIYFGFTTCPEVCPTALGKMTATLDALGEKDAAKVQPLFITVDPERDTAERLRAHLDYDPRLLGLTGTLEQIEAAKKALNVYAKKVPMPDSALEYTMDHQRLFFITGPDGTAEIAISDAAPTEQLAQLLEERLK